MHQKTREVYNEAGFKKDETPQEAIRKVFEQKTKRSEPKYVINQVWRVSRGPDKEFIVYDRLTIKEDVVGNEEKLPEMVGVYERPRFQKQFDPQSGDTIAVHVKGHDDVYDIPFSKAKMKEILESGDSSNTKFVLNTGSARYGGIFSADDFINLSYEELFQKATGGAAAAVPSSDIAAMRPVRDFKTPKDVDKEQKEQQKAEEEEQKALRDARQSRLDRQTEMLEIQRKKLMEERQKMMDEIIEKRKQKNGVADGSDAGDGDNEQGTQKEGGGGTYTEPTRVKEDVIALVRPGNTAEEGETTAATTNDRNVENDAESSDKDTEEETERKTGRKQRKTQEE